MQFISHAFFFFHLRWNTQQTFRHPVCSTGLLSSPDCWFCGKARDYPKGPQFRSEELKELFILPPSCYPAAKVLGRVTTHAGHPTPPPVKYLLWHQSPLPSCLQEKSKSLSWDIGPSQVAPAYLSISSSPSALAPWHIQLLHCSKSSHTCRPLLMLSVCLGHPSCLDLICSSLQISFQNSIQVSFPSSFLIFWEQKPFLFFFEPSSPAKGQALSRYSAAAGEQNPTSEGVDHQEIRTALQSKSGGSCEPF